MTRFSEWKHFGAKYLLLHFSFLVKNIVSVSERRQLMIDSKLNFIGFSAPRELQLLGAGEWP